MCSGGFEQYRWVVTITRAEDNRASWTARGVHQYDGTEIYVLRHNQPQINMLAAEEDFLRYAEKNRITDYSICMQEPVYSNRNRDVMQK